MATSHIPTDIEAEFLIDGSYVSTYSGYDLTHRVRGGNGEGSIRISRGVADYQAGVSAQTAQFTLNNADGLFTDDNANSPLYGKFGQNVRARLGVKSGGTWGEYLRMPDYRNESVAQYGYTADKASLDITSDIDIRVEFSPTYTRGREQVLIAKYNTTGNQRSWALFLEASGALQFRHSTDGTLANTLINVTTPVIAENTTRIAVRLTLDVNDGAGNRVYTYYTSDSITGTWTSFATGTVAGTTSIFASTAILSLGSGDGGNVILDSNFAGKIHAAEVYSGIAGTKVADFKPDGQGLETTTWADACASPNTWILNGTEVRLASDRVRITGELITNPIDWDVTGRDVFSQMTLAGLLARYSANKGPIRGSIYNYYRTDSNVTDYWPCEDSEGATQIASAVTGGRAASFFGCTFGSPTGIDGSTGAITLTTSTSSFAKFRAGPVFADTGVTTAVFRFRLADVPAADQIFSTIYISGGTANRFRFTINATQYTFALIDATNTTLSTATVAFGVDPVNTWITFSVKLTQEGANTRWETVWNAVGGTTFYTHAGGGTTYVGTSGQFYQQNIATPTATFEGTQVCHVVLTHGANLTNSVDVANVDKAWASETFGARCKRLCAQEGVFFQWRGDLSDTLTVGPQFPDTLYNILVAGLKVAGGILAEPRDIIGFELITQRYLGNRRGLELDYSQSHIEGVPTPVNDTRFLLNDFTASRINGASARYEADDGRRKNVNDPPTGIGRWEREDSYAADTDDQMILLASREVFLGTWEERRVPNLSINLSRTEIANTSTLLRRVIATDLGDPVNLTGLSASPLPPNDLLMTVFGYTESITNMMWTLVANTVPAGPFQVPILDDYAGRYPRMDVDDSTHSVLKSSLTSGATSFVVKTDAASTRRVKVWVDSTNYAAEIGGGSTIDINIDGERITISDIGTPTLTGGFNEQPFTVSARSVNGYVKAHSAGATVKLWTPYYLGAE